MKYENMIFGFKPKDGRLQTSRNLAKIKKNISLGKHI
jgi:hypothetical protein